MKKLIFMFALLLCFTGCARGDATGAPATEAQDGDVITVSIDQLKPGEVVCVGSFDLEKRQLHFDVAAEDGAGLFIGVHRDDGITDQESVLWEYSPTTSATGRSVELSHDINLKGTHYIYVGCDERGEVLTGVSGTIACGDS